MVLATSMGVMLGVASVGFAWRAWTGLFLLFCFRVSIGTYVETLSSLAAGVMMTKLGS